MLLPPAAFCHFKLDLLEQEIPLDSQHAKQFIQQLN
jgi:hypothetical protein